MTISGVVFTLPMVAAAAGAIVTSLLAYLLVSVKIELWRLQKTLHDENAGIRSRCEVMEGRVVQMENTVREAEVRAAVLVPPPTSRSGMNLNKRIQAARMSKRGGRPEQIAAALGLPANEVKLLLKVQRLTLPN